MDDGSTVTMLDEEVAHNLGLKGLKSSLTCAIYLSLTCAIAKGAHRNDPESMLVQAEMSGIGKNMKRNTLRQIRTVETVGVIIQHLDWDYLKEKYPYLENVDSSQFTQAPKLLIGQNNVHLMNSKITIQPTLDQPCITRIMLGWPIKWG